MTHLTLDQCKKLKELGFPQDSSMCWLPELQTPKNDRFYIAREGDGEMIWHLTFRQPNTTRHMAAPTLEELIEWLGDEFNSLEHYHNADSDHTYYGSTRDGYGIDSRTPLEAVYNLAVAIKQPV